MKTFKDVPNLHRELERQSHEVAAFASAAVSRWGENSWFVIEPYLADAWTKIGSASRVNLSWGEIRSFLRETWPR